MNTPTLSHGARLTAVRLKNNQGQEIGKIVEWFMDVERGQVLYVIASFHDRDNLFAIPWSFLKADLEHGGYSVDQGQVEQSNLKVERETVSELVDDKDFLQRVIQLGSTSQTGREEGGPSGNESRERQSTHSTTQSNAEVGEGKGYGG